MPTIHLQTFINSSISICFDLSRNIDVHVRSTTQTNERAIAGRISGLIGLGETVTWEALHFGIKQQLTSKITALDAPFHFRDEQVKGIFKSMKHDHYFEQKDAFVLMNDTFAFESPLGILGKLANQLFLTKYMTELLYKRNQCIKDFAESDKWKTVLEQQHYI